MSYVENPKTKGSGIYCAIPQEYEPCAQNCADCFFQNGRSYLEPLAENLPNIPPRTIINNFVIRVNDGLDSGQNIDRVIEETADYPNKFYNTADSLAVNALETAGPVVLTINPGELTDQRFYNYRPKFSDLMFVRFRANIWNQDLLARAVGEWCGHGVPLVITYMRYYDEKNIPVEYQSYYSEKAHILNPSWSINQSGWYQIHDPYYDNPLVSTCGAAHYRHGCKSCGVCLREYWKAMAR